MKFTVSECTGQWLLVHSPHYATITTNSRTVSSLPKETHLQSISPPPSPSPWQFLVCFPSLQICLFSAFHIDGTVH